MGIIDHCPSLDELVDEIENGRVLDNLKITKS